MDKIANIGFGPFIKSLNPMNGIDKAYNKYLRHYLHMFDLLPDLLHDLADVFPTAHLLLLSRL